MRPAGDAVPHDAVFLLALFPGAFADLHLFGHLVVPELEEVPGGLLAPGADNHGHVVEHVEAVEGRRVVSAQVRSPAPPEGAFGGDPHDLAEPVVVEFLPGNLHQLLNGVLDLAAHVAYAVLGNVEGMIEGHVKHYQGNLQGLRQILVPFDNGVADVAAAEDQVGHGDILRFGELDVRVAHIDPRVGADVGGIAFGLGVCDELGRVLPGSDGGRMILRIHYINVQSFQQLLRTDGGGPGHQLALLLRLHGAGVVLRLQLCQKLLGRQRVFHSWHFLTSRFD